MNGYQFIIPRLNGDEIKKDFDKYLSLVRRGVAGFIIFGGKLHEVRQAVAKLQQAAELPLIIAADLERGLGQQLSGGTPFPPAMAVARAVLNAGSGEKSSAVSYSKCRTLLTGASGQTPKHLPLTTDYVSLRLLRRSFRALAEEARYAGINTVFAPVLDINTNPANPIIGVRAFGEEPNTVSIFGSEMIKALQENGIAACGKHFPGHGDTSTDSHIGLPRIDRPINRLSRTELLPFRAAIRTGVCMIMMGHLDVPALDPSGTPVSLSGKAVSYLRNKLKFDGLIITDAMNMGGLSGFTEEEASARALKAGVNVILHPSKPNKVAAYLEQTGRGFDNRKLTAFRCSLPAAPEKERPDFSRNLLLSDSILRLAISVPRRFVLRTVPVVVLVADEANPAEKPFIQTLKKEEKGISVIRIMPDTDASAIITRLLKEKRQVISAFFSETRAWKGDTAAWLANFVKQLSDATDLFVSFGNPYLLKDIPESRKVLTLWSSESAGKIAAEKILKRLKT